jgi:hypothetical protein
MAVTAAFRGRISLSSLSGQARLARPVPMPA